MDAPAGGGASRPRRGVIGGVVAGLLLLLTKGKALLLLLATKGGALLSALKFGKLGATLLTMGASIGYYASLYHWKFALGLVVLILVHELGHGLAAKRLGLKVGAPIFIPGFGAVIALKEQPRSTWASAIIGYGGPLAGTLGGVVVLAFGRFAFDAGLATVLAHVTFLLNCFNLVPVGGLDGDRISEPLERSHWGAGLAFTAVVAVLMMEGESRPGGRTNPQLVFVLAILLLGIVKAIRVHRRAAAVNAGDSGRLVDRLVGREAGYTEEAGVLPWQRRATAIAYFGLVGLLTCLAALSEPPPR
jgi:Zn-dependent protease